MKKNPINKMALTATILIVLFYSCRKEPLIAPRYEESVAAESVPGVEDESIPSEENISAEQQTNPAIINATNVQTVTGRPIPMNVPAGWRQIQRSPIPFKRFDVLKKNGVPMKPNQIVILKSGKRITVQTYLARLNSVEQKLNSQGYTLRNNRPVVASQMVTESQYLDGMIPRQPKAIRALRVGSDLENFMSPTRKVGNILLKPVTKYTATELSALKGYSFTGTGTSITGIKLYNPATTAPVDGKFIEANPIPLKKIYDSDVKEWSFGKESTFRATIRGELIRMANIFPFDPQNPDKTMSDFRVLGKGKVEGSLFNHSINVLNGVAEFFAPANSTRNMNAKVIVQVAGITIYGLNKTYAQETKIGDTKTKAFDKSFSIEVPIALGVNFTGKIGVKGNVGLKYEATLGRGYVTGRVAPVGQLKGYAEAGVEFLDFIGGGVGGELTFVDGKLELRGSIFLALQNASQIVVGYSYYFGADITMLKGRLYCYTEACIPFTDVCYRPIEHDFFTWGGFVQRATILEGSNTYTIANL